MGEDISNTQSICRCCGRGPDANNAGSLSCVKVQKGGTSLAGTSPDLVYPAKMEPQVTTDTRPDADAAKRQKICRLLDQCASARCMSRKVLAINNLNLTAADIPVEDLCGTPLGNSLRKLSLIGNPLSSPPDRLVKSLPALGDMDLSRCELHRLPDKWSLPQLKTLNLSHNKLTEFPGEVRT
jgi:Leucine rich repeat